MKRSLCFFLFLGMASVFSFALEEAWFTVGVGYGNSVDIRQNQAALVDGYAGSLGIAVTMYSFTDTQNIGMFGAVSTTYLMTASIPDEIDNYGSTQYEGLFGVGFRRPIADRLTLVYAGGFDFLSDNFNYRGTGNERVEGRSSNIGIGGDIGLKFDLANVLCLNIGTIASYHFLNHTRINGQTSYDSEWIINSRFGIKPYLSIAINLFYQEKIGLGRP